MLNLKKTFSLIGIFTICLAAHAQTLPVNTQASIFKNAGISCLKAPSRVNIARDASVDNYLNNVGGQFEKNPRIQSQLRSLLSRFPDHPHLNWQAGWLAYLNNDFSGTIHHLKKSAIQGDPNAAHILAYIALGALDGGDALKPDESTKYMPVDLGIAMQCLKVAYEWGETVEKDRPSIDLQMYYGVRYTAAEFLAALYLHDLNYFVDGGPVNVRKNFISNGDLSKVEFNPKRAAEVVKLLQKNQKNIK